MSTWVSIGKQKTSINILDMTGTNLYSYVPANVPMSEIDREIRKVRLVAQSTPWLWLTSREPDGQSTGEVLSRFI